MFKIYKMQLDTRLGVAAVDIQTSSAILDPVQTMSSRILRNRVDRVKVIDTISLACSVG
jgi:hypothetical protein